MPKILATNASKTFPDSISMELYDHFDIYCDYEEIPIPWDAGIEVENGKIVLTGSIKPGGPGSNGSYAVLYLGIKDFNKYISLESSGRDLPEELVTAIEEAGWEVK